MSGSITINAALAQAGVPDETFAIAIGHPCMGAKFHSPRPLVTRRFFDVDYVFVNEVWLCPTCYENLKVLLHLAGKVEALEWTILREFGNQLRALGMTIAQNRRQED